MKKVCIFLANGHEEVEALTVVDLLRRASIDITMVSIEEDNTITGAHNIKIIADKKFEDIDYSDMDMLILPGGMPGTNNLAKHNGLIEILKDFNQKKKWIAAICAAPSILGVNGILKEKEACCYPGFETQLEGANVLINSVVLSENVITSRGLGTAIEFSGKIIEVLQDKALSDKIKEAVIYHV